MNYYLQGQFFLILHKLRSSLINFNCSFIHQNNKVFINFPKRFQPFDSFVLSISFERIIFKSNSSLFLFPVNGKMSLTYSKSYFDNDFSFNNRSIFSCIIDGNSFDSNIFLSKLSNSVFFSKCMIVWHASKISLQQLYIPLIRAKFEFDIQSEPSCKIVLESPELFLLTLTVNQSTGAIIAEFPYLGRREIEINEIGNICQYVLIDTQYPLHFSLLKRFFHTPSFSLRLHKLVGLTVHFSSSSDFYILISFYYHLITIVSSNSQKIFKLFHSEIFLHQKFKSLFFSFIPLLYQLQKQIILLEIEKLFSNFRIISFLVDNKIILIHKSKLFIIISIQESGYWTVKFCEENYHVIFTKQYNFTYENHFILKFPIFIYNLIQYFLGFHSFCENLPFYSQQQFNFNVNFLETKYHFQFFTSKFISFQPLTIPSEFQQHFSSINFSTTFTSLTFKSFPFIQFPIPFPKSLPLLITVISSLKIFKPLNWVIIKLKDPFSFQFIYQKIITFSIQFISSNNFCAQISNTQSNLLSKISLELLSYSQKGNSFFVYLDQLQILKDIIETDFEIINFLKMHKTNDFQIENKSFIAKSTTFHFIYSSNEFLFESSEVSEISCIVKNLKLKKDDMKPIINVFSKIYQSGYFELFKILLLITNSPYIIKISILDSFQQASFGNDPFFIELPINEYHEEKYSIKLMSTTISILNSDCFLLSNFTLTEFCNKLSSPFQYSTLKHQLLNNK
jgi:hypothetical protein